MRKRFAVIITCTVAAVAVVSIGLIRATPTKSNVTTGSSPADAQTQSETLNVRYAAKVKNYIENVNTAAKKALDQLGYFRTGETPRRDGITHYARTHGDIEVTVDLDKRVIESKEGEKSEWIYVNVRYGSLGNCQQSQQIVSKITANLK